MPLDRLLAHPAVLPAYFDLLAVRSITQAVGANLIAAGGVPGPLGTIQNPGSRFGPAATVHHSPETNIEGRYVHQPEPRIEGRFVHHPEPWIEPRLVDRPVIERPEHVPGPHTLLNFWEESLPESDPVKSASPTADKAVMPNTPGALLDLFA